MSIAEKAYIEGKFLLINWLAVTFGGSYWQEKGWFKYGTMDLNP